MRESVEPIVRRLLFVAALAVLFSGALQAQESVLIVCNNPKPCQYRRVYSVTVQGKNKVKTLGVQAASDARLFRKAPSVGLNSIPGLFREPKSGIIRILNRDGRKGDIVLPSKPSEGASTASSAWDGAALEYREQPKSKTAVPVPMDRFVALLSGSSPEPAVVAFIRNQIRAAEAHPMQKELIAGALEFAAKSEELRIWRDELRGTMSESLRQFKARNVDPAQMEATLEEGLAAMRIHRMVAADGQKEEVSQKDLIAEHRKLIERFAIANVLKKTGLHDSYLEKINQIGLAHWSRPEVGAGIEQSRKASADLHYEQATKLFSAKQYARAFDESQLASARAPCDSKMNDYYDNVRVEFVNTNVIPVAPDYQKENRGLLQQIVRQLQGIGQKETLTPENLDFFRARIDEGERMDKDYLPLQLKKADFLAVLGELTAAREVVTRVQRTVKLDRTQAEEWLQLDASLKRKLATTRQAAEKSVAEHFDKGEFKEAVEAAAIGLKAEPANPKLLYFSAVASAVLRDQPKTKQFVEQYLQSVSPDCTVVAAGNATKTLFDLYRRNLGVPTRSVGADGRIPHWMSGELYRHGDVFYDPLSGGFHPQVMSVIASTSLTQFRWDGFMVTSITTAVGAGPVKTTVFEVEPKYKTKQNYMTEIGSKANSAGERRTTSLMYLNSPEFDPLLAAKFTGKLSTRGWTGNPFFHPFLWTDIFIFDLVYDELGRIKEAVPVVGDVRRPRSPFSETLKFAWDGSSKRLSSISGARYRREMKYDGQGRLKSEKITYPKGNGNIEYEYYGDTMQLKVAKYEDDIFAKVPMAVSFYSNVQ